MSHILKLIRNHQTRTKTQVSAGGHVLGWLQVVSQQDESLSLLYYWICEHQTNLIGDEPKSTSYYLAQLTHKRSQLRLNQQLKESLRGKYDFEVQEGTKKVLLCTQFRRGALEQPRWKKISSKSFPLNQSGISFSHIQKKQINYIFQTRKSNNNQIFNSCTYVSVYMESHKTNPEFQSSAIKNFEEPNHIR